MLTVFMILSGLAADFPRVPEGPTFHRPYGKEDVDFIYNLLFCDNPDLFRPRTGKVEGPYALILAKTPDLDALTRLAGDDKQEGRIRAMAYHRLRAAGAKVPQGQLLGVVVEVPMESGLDVLATFTDGGIRYINHTAKMTIVEGRPAAMQGPQQALMKASAAAIKKIGPWEKPRRPPPKAPLVRMTFLVSDGLYFGEAPFEAMAKDAIGGPVLDTASQLLSAVVSASTKR
jgi:hypothetical protein